jgi:hypothetical protein
MFGRRFLILVIVLMGLTALAATVAPREPVVREDREQPTPTPAAASGSPTFATVEETVSTDDDDARVSVRAGDLIELTVTGTERDSVKVLDRIDSIDPTTPARFSLLPRVPGEYPIELLAAGREVGTLVVREAG